MIEQVPMFTARCDVCRQSSCDKGAQYAGWTERDAVIVVRPLIDSDVAVGDEGVICWGCIPPELCAALDGEEGHTFEAHGGDCGEGCGRNIADLLAAHIASEAVSS